MALEEEVRATAARIFARLDRDGDGHVTKTELKLSLKEDKSGELRKLLLPPKRKAKLGGSLFKETYARIIDAIDGDGDGSLDVGEIEAYLLKLRRAADEAEAATRLQSIQRGRGGRAKAGAAADGTQTGGVRSKLFGGSRQKKVAPDSSPADLLLDAARCQRWSEATELVGHTPLDLDVRDASGCTALWYAVAHGHDTMLDALARGGADVNARGVGGHAPLHVAAAHGQLACVRVLIDAGADADARNERGDRPIDVARASTGASRSIVSAILDLLEPSRSA